MKKSMPLVTLVATLVAGSQAYACAMPSGPSSIPDGKSSSMDEMMATKKAVDQYKKDVEAYLACAKDQRSADNVQADLERVANKFNAEVRAYKAASSGK
jgi:hypothetical protein